jgi:hypothetical protein
VQGNQQSWGYLDDECDGIVRVELAAGGKTLSAFARFGAGPPAFAPDGLPVRTTAARFTKGLIAPIHAALAPGTSEFRPMEIWPPAIVLLAVQQYPWETSPQVSTASCRRAGCLPGMCTARNPAEHAGRATSAEADATMK